MEIRLINLDRTPERLTAFHARNPGFGTITRVPAIDGQRINRDELIANDMTAHHLTYTNGAIGCALSHITQWNDAIQRQQPLTIIEDDAVLCANFHAESARLIAGLPADWEVVVWGYNLDTWLMFDMLPGVSPCTARFNQDAVTRGINSLAEKNVHSQLFRVLRSLGTVAYSISPRGAERLMRFCLPLRPMDTFHPGLDRALSNTGIDNMMANHWPTMQAFVAVPPLVVTENLVAQSTVQTGDYVVTRPATPESGQAPIVQVALAEAPAPRHEFPVRRVALQRDGKLSISFDRSWENRRRNLVLIPASDQSLHRQWTQDLDPGERSWDLALTYYGDADHYDATFEDIIIAQKARKFAGIHRILTELDLLQRYDAIWIPDDDIHTSWSNVNNLFWLFDKLELSLAQPALTVDSHYTHDITLMRSASLTRFTNFVEVMAPVFSRDALIACAPAGARAVTNWGLDVVWPRLLGNPVNRIGIMDAVPVRHTRPVGGGDSYTGIAVSANEEMVATMHRYGITRAEFQTYGALAQGALTLPFTGMRPQLQQLEASMALA